MTEVFEIPRDWKVVTLQEIAEGKNAIVDGPFGSNLKTSDYVDDSVNGVPVLTTKNLEGDYSDNKVRFISKKKFEELKRSQVVPGDILVAKIGSIGKTGIYPKNARTAIIPANLLKFTVSKKVNFSYVFYYLNSRGLQNRIKGIATATAQPAFNVTKFRKLQIPLPPLPEQHRIVEKIEALFSELDKGVEQLKTAAQQLKVYRQSVLKWAFEGKLTQEWRKSVGTHGSTFFGEDTVGTHGRVSLRDETMKIAAEPTTEYSVGADGRPPNEGARGAPLRTAHELLSLIKQEREAQAKASGKKLKPIAPLTERELAELPPLPEGWAWVALNDVSSGVEYGSAAKSRDKGKIPVLRMGNIQNGRFDWTDLVFTDDKDEINKYLLKPNDVLFNRTNSAELVGKTAIYKGERPAIFAGYLIRINGIASLVNADYLTYFLNSHIARSHGNTVKTFGVNQSNINGTKLLGYPLPLTDLSEQYQIVQEIERRLSVCDKLEETIAASLQQAEALRQSILKKAFEGKLVEQDANDEPASVLLERIKQEKENKEKSVARIKRNSPPSPSLGKRGGPRG